MNALIRHSTTNDGGTIGSPTLVVAPSPPRPNAWSKFYRLPGLSSVDLALRQPRAGQVANATLVQGNHRRLGTSLPPASRSIPGGFSAPVRRADDPGIP